MEANYCFVFVAAPESFRLLRLNLSAQMSREELSAIRFNHSLLTPDFGFYLISSEPVQSQIREKTYGAALMQINIRDLRKITLWLPALKEQTVIAATLDALSEETQRLALLYERKLELLAALKKSLLNEAFTGKL